jgi:LPXTG-site transpeptidase (sortase) family protein
MRVGPVGLQESGAADARQGEAEEMSHSLHALRHRVRHVLGTIAIAALLLALPPVAQGLFSGRSRVAEAAPSFGRPAHGDLVARVFVPRMGLEFPVLEGADAGTLSRGAGRVEASALPGEARGLQHCVIAVAEEEKAALVAALRLGDIIDVTTPFGMRHMKVVERRLVAPKEFSIAPSERPRVTLAARAASPDGIGPSEGRILVSAE